MRAKVFMNMGRAIGAVDIALVARCPRLVAAALFRAALRMRAEGTVARLYSPLRHSSSFARSTCA